MAQIVFLYRNANMGSDQMRAIQIAKELQKRNLPVRTIPVKRNGKWIPPSELKHINYSIVFIIKMFSIDHLRVLKQNGNILVYDIVDRLINGSASNLSLFDCILTGSEWLSNHLFTKYKYKGHLEVLHHQWDPRYANIVVSAPELLFGYIGCGPVYSKNLYHAQELVSRGIQVINSESGQNITPLIRNKKNVPIEYRSDNIERMQINFKVHLNIRDPKNLEYFMKTNVKVSTAAVLDSLILTTSDPPASEILGEDYPYYIKSTQLDDILSAINYVKETYKTDIGEKAKKIMRSIKERTSIEHIANDYIRLCESLSLKLSPPINATSSKLGTICQVNNTN